MSTPLSLFKFSDKLFCVAISLATEKFALSVNVIFSMCRFFFFAHIIGRLYNVGPNDVVYCALPLYHTAGGAIQVSFCTLLGATMVISRKFSASRFFEDCVKYNVTVSKTDVVY